MQLQLYCEQTFNKSSKDNAFILRRDVFKDDLHDSLNEVGQSVWISVADNTLGDILKFTMKQFFNTINCCKNRDALWRNLSLLGGHADRHEWNTYGLGLGHPCQKLSFPLKPSPGPVESSWIVHCQQGLPEKRDHQSSAMVRPHNQLFPPTWQNRSSKKCHQNEGSHPGAHRVLLKPNLVHPQSWEHRCTRLFIWAAWSCNSQKLLDHAVPWALPAIHVVLGWETGATLGDHGAMAVIFGP